MKFIELGSHKIEVSVSMGKRMVRQSDTKELLQLSDDEVNDYFIDAGFVVDRLFQKIYVEKTATREQRAIYKALFIVGIYALIDEVCEVDLRKVSYVDEFTKMIEIKTLEG